MGVKTAEEKAFNLLHSLNIKGTLYANLVGPIALALKEQDRDTRRACAETLATLEKYRYAGGDMMMIDVREAQTVCMNVKAV
jgi:hypothetical protein